MRCTAGHILLALNQAACAKVSCPLISLSGAKYKLHGLFVARFLFYHLSMSFLANSGCRREQPLSTNVCG